MSTEDISCTKYCNRKEHGDFINAALTKRAVNDAELSAFLNYTCILCGSSKDVYGRTALHMAAACGRTNVCKWLVCQKQAKIDEKDIESGYTSLHRSIFYGKIETAIALIQLGGNLKILDSNDLTPLDHAMQDNLKPFDDLHSPFIYVWGSNTNYTLGPNQVRHYPEVLDSFHKLFPMVEPKQIYLEKFHTVILSTTGDVYSFGMGQGGRLGIGTEKAVLEPTEMKFVTGNGATVKISQCAIARDHCLFLTDAHEVWCCGLNTHHVLGITPPPAQLLTPRPIQRLKSSIEGISCGRYHSIAWTSHALYTWGFNGGQLGHGKSNDQTILPPKLVTSISSQNRKIISAAASNGATAIATDKGDVYILHEFQCRTIASKNLGIMSVEIFGGKLAVIDEKREDLRVLALTKTGDILIWQESDPQLCRCIFSLNRLLKVRQVCLNAYGLVFITEDREVFNGKFKARKRKNVIQQSKKHFNNFLERNDCVTIQVEKVFRLYGANSIVCDLEGHNFACLYLNTSSMITLVPEISNSTMSEDFEKLIDVIDVEPDLIFKVGGRVFSTHKFIIRACSQKLSEINASGEYVIINNVEPEIFEEVIIYIYTGTCNLLKEGEIPQNLAKFNKNLKKKQTNDNNKINNKNSNKKLSAFEVYQQQEKQENKMSKENEINDPIRLLQESAKKLGINSLYKDLNLFTISYGKIKLKSDKCYRPRLLKYKQGDFPELHDVRIKGTCGKYIEAHKCILAARSEFFTNMFSMRWMQNNSKTEIELPTNIECIRYLIDYLYMDQVDLEHEDFEQILNLLILADHILLDRLVEICEFALSKLITIKNVLKLLTLADIYNTTQLKQTCMEFTCLNLALFLETRHLEQLDEELLRDLTRFYGRWNNKMPYRVITPYNDATSDEVIKDVSAKFPVKMDFNEIIKVQPQKAHRKRNRTHRTSTSDKNDNRTCADAKEKENIPMEIHRISEDDDFGRLQMRSSLPISAPVRISAICKAHEKINDVLDDMEFVNLSLRSEKDFPDLSTSFGSPDLHDCSSGYQKHTPKQKSKMTRLSQKERKRLSSECSVKEVVVPESPKNPWNMNFEASSPVTTPTFGNIITEERKQKENLSRIKSKLLIYTQLEDKALEDLERFYNVENVFDEIIDVRRVDCGQIAVPLWIQK